MLERFGRLTTPPPADATGLLRMDGLTVQVVGIYELIRMKRAAGRPKDLIELEVLGALRDELDLRR